MLIKDQQTNKTTFTGKTRIFALTDSHLQTREKGALLSKIIKEAKKKNNVLALDGGDMFKGIYPPQLEIDSYITAKKMAPDLEIVINVGNNDPGYTKAEFDFFKKSIKTLSENGIHVVSANTWDKLSGERIEGVKPYAVIKKDNDKILITGFCVNNLTQTTYGVKSEDPKKVLENLKKTIETEKPDGLIIMNHDWFTQSQELMEFARKQNIKVDLIIGGHEHNKFAPDKKRKIYYPEAFNRSMYQFDLFLNKDKNRLKNIKLHQNKNLKINKELDKQVKQAEESSGLFTEVAPSILNLTKAYSEPCALGTFLADAMKEEGKTDIAFFSTGFLMAPLPYQKGKKLLEYDIKKAITAQTPIQKTTVTPNILKEVFQNALDWRMNKDRGNSKFLQCSHNIKLEGEGNPSDKTYKLKQIFINDEPLLDEKTGNPLNPEQQITCAIDSYIGGGNQGFTALKNTKKEKLTPEGDIPINTLLKNALKKISEVEDSKREYPTFQIKD